MEVLRKKIKHKVFTGILLAGVAFASTGKAALITPSLQSFVLTNMSADGTVDIANSGLSFVLTGGNTGRGTSGTTDFTGTAQNAGTVQFSFSYASADDPLADTAGYLLGNTLFQLADRDGKSDFGSFAVSQGQRYGFYVNTIDNTGEPGILSVAFSPGSSAVPEPAGFALSLIGVAVLSVTRSRLVRASGFGEKTA